MRMVRTGLTRALGSRLRRIIRRYIGNRFSAFLAGLGVTVVLQSSTATAMMISSFAGRGLIPVATALAVMLGADVGTTLVAQVLAFDVSRIFPLLLGLGVIVHFSSRNTLARQLGRTAIGLGLMLLALQLIATATSPLQESQIIQDMLEAVTGDIFIGIVIAALLTWLTHSSLAVILLIMSLAANGVITPEFSIVLVLGANLGGTMPPLMATLGAGAEARRVPLANTLFKLTGCLIVLPFIAIAGDIVAAIDSDPARMVVNFHTLFNLMLAAIFLLLTDGVAAFMAKILPAKPPTEERSAPPHLDISAIEEPTVALAGAARETLRMGDIVETMMRDAFEAISGPDASVAKSVRRMDDSVDRLHENIKRYVAEVTRQEMDLKESQRAAEIISFATNLEHIGDIIENLMEMAEKKHKRRVQFSDAGREELADIHAKVSGNLKLAFSVFLSGDIKVARRLLAEKKKVNADERRYSDRHLARLREGRRDSIETSALHLDILRDFKRIHSHIVAVVYPVLDRAGELGDTGAAEEPPKDDARDQT